MPLLGLRVVAKGRKREGTNLLSSSEAAKIYEPGQAEQRLRSYLLHQRLAENSSQRQVNE